MSVASSVEHYDAAIFSLPDYARDLGIEQHFIRPAINPFSPKNRDLSDGEIAECQARYRVPTDRLLVTQISRFDRWKDPMGVIDAFHKACEQSIAGSLWSATMRAMIRRARSSSTRFAIRSTSGSSSSRPTIRSTREGFGLTVTEAMWKGAAVVVGNVGGIRHQIQDGENGWHRRRWRGASDRGGSNHRQARPAAGPSPLRGKVQRQAHGAAIPGSLRSPCKNRPLRRARLAGASGKH
jgi:trehalose synthase